jgi:hypothetical protein
LSSDGSQGISGFHGACIRIWNLQYDNPVNTDLLDDWNMSEDGWVVGREGQLQVPPDLRTGLKWPQNTAVIYKRGSLELRFDGVLFGTRWQDCYVP